MDIYSIDLNILVYIKLNLDDELNLKKNSLNRRLKKLVLTEY